jgi:uncharacterized protein Yka (UPF0111/DUF47 family)
MVSIAALTEHYKQAFTEQQAKILVEGAVAIEHDRVNREDFSKLTATVERLADRMGGLADRMDSLAAAQERTDEQMTRLAAAQERTDEQMTRLAAAQERTDGRIDQLSERMGELASAQKQTESRMDQLTHRVDQLAESQQSMQRTFERFMVRTEEQFTSVRQELRETTGALEKKMDASFADVRKQLGGLSLSVGMGLEAYALDRIPRLLEMHCGFKTETVCPEAFTDGGQVEEIDVVVRGSIAGRPAVVVCEVKTNISQTEVRDFFGRVDRVRSRLGCDDVRVLFFGYRAAPETHGMIEAEGGWLALPAGILRINRQAG